MWILFGLIGLLLLYLLFDYYRGMRRDRIMSRLEYGFSRDEEALASLWDGASDLLQLNSIRQLILRSRITRTVDLHIRRAGLKLSILQAMLLLLVVALVAELAIHWFFNQHVVSVAAMLLAPLMLWLLWRFLSQRQQQKMDAQLPSLINSMLTTMRAGGTPIQALMATSRNANPPMKDSITQVLNELQLGQSPTVVWKNWSDFWDTKSCKLLSTGIRVKWEAGGQMSPVLEHILDSIEFRKKIEQRINTLTTQAKIGSWVLSAIPPLLLLMQYRVRPEFVTEMFGDNVGQKMYLLAGGLSLLGFFWLRKLAGIKME